MMTHTSYIRHIGLTVFAAFMALASMTATAQERTGRFQRTVDFVAPKTVTLNAAIGPVKISTVEFTDLGRGYSGSGFAARMRAGTDSELSTALRTRLMIDNPSDDEWQLTLTLELLDKDGKVIDKLTKRDDYEDETAAWTIEHPLLEYVLPLVKQVRITIEGRIT